MSTPEQQVSDAVLEIWKNTGKHVYVKDVVKQLGWKHWKVYKLLREGVPGVAMYPTGSKHSRWQFGPTRERKQEARHEEDHQPV